MSTVLKSPMEAKEGLARRGITVRSWSKENDLSERVVQQVLRGRLIGQYGQSHKAAVLLGIKDGVLE